MPDASSDVPRERASARAWYVLALLFLVYCCNVADRHVLSILAQSIKRDLHLSDTEIGLLIGPAIAFFYAVLGLPMAYVADRVHRVRFLAFCLVAWSMFTALGGVAAGALQLAATRLGVSAVEAGGTPTSSSLIADYFPARSRGLAMGIFAAAGTIGVLLSFGLGGFANDAWGWRWTLVAAGVPGIVLCAILLLTVAEPKRGAHDPSMAVLPAPPFRETIRILAANPLFRWGVIATGAANFGFHSVLNWGPSFIIRQFYDGAGKAGSAGFALGMGIALCGGGVAIFGGGLISGMSARGMGKPLRITALLEMLSAPLMLAALLAPRLDLSVVLMCLSYGCQAFSVPIYFIIAQSWVPSSVRATATAIMLLALAIVGPGIAAPVLGALSDALVPRFGHASLQHALMIGTVANLICALLYWRAARAADRVAATEHSAA